MLNVAGPFHSALMQPAADKMAEVLQETAFKPPEIPVISNYDAAANTDPGRIPELLVKQLISPVRWTDSMQLLVDEGVEQVIELGPKKVLIGLMRQINKDMKTAQIEDVDTLKEALKLLG